MLQLFTAIRRTSELDFPYFETMISNEVKVALESCGLFRVAARESGHDTIVELEPDGTVSFHVFPVEHCIVVNFEAPNEDEVCEQLWRVASSADDDLAVVVGRTHPDTGRMADADKVLADLSRKEWYFTRGDLGPTLDDYEVPD